MKLNGKRVAIIAISFFAAHFVMDIYKNAVKDGTATKAKMSKESKK